MAFGQVIAVTFDDADQMYATGAYFVGNDGFYGELAQVNQVGTNWFGTNLPIPPDGHWGFFQVASGPSGQVFVTKEEDNALWQASLTGANWVWHRMGGQAQVAGSTDGTNDTALFNWPFAMAVDGNGTIFVTDWGNNTIRKIAPAGGTNWAVTTIAGQAPNSASADGTNRAALFSSPYGVAVDSRGSVFVADPAAHAIRETRRVGNDWVTRTIAGLLGSPGASDGTNTEARLNSPFALVADGCGAIYVADTGNNTIRKVQRFGTNWVTSTIAGLVGSTNRQDGTNLDIHLIGPNAIGRDAAGNLYVAEYDYLAIRKLTHVGSNWISSRIADPSGPISLQQPLAPEALAVTSDGTVYFADSFEGVDELTHAGTNWTLTNIAGSVDPIYATGIAVDGSGNLLAADTGNNIVRKLVQFGTNWVSYTIGGQAASAGQRDGTGADARFLGPSAIAVDAEGNLYVTDGQTLRMGVRVPVSASAPFIVASFSTNAAFTLTWTGTPGLYYQPQYSLDPTSGTWFNLSGPILAATPLVSATDLFAAHQQRFYRIVLLP